MPSVLLFKDLLQESVRGSATTLLRTLRGLTLRLVDPSHTAKGEAAEAVSIILPFLVKGGKPKLQKFSSCSYRNTPPAVTIIRMVYTLFTRHKKI